MVSNADSDHYYHQYHLSFLIFLAEMIGLGLWFYLPSNMLLVSQHFLCFKFLQFEGQKDFF